ncbi:MAG: CRP/FNR family cyclic AMP-dependent transcriptional regulator [Saprospiraceae bacterium]|jgi:CRP/FNR family cyclic AMP-dependent transcriptional regulator
MTAQLFNLPFGQVDMISMLKQNMTSENVQLYKTKSFLKNKYIYLPHKKADHIFIVKEGRVKIGVHSNKGKEVIKKIAVKGEIFGEFFLIGQTVHQDYAITMEDTEVYTLSIVELQSLMKNNQVLNLYLMQILGNRLMDMEHRLESLVFKNSRSRIIDFLENLVYRRGQRIGYEMLVRQFFTHQEIANLTETSRQTVTMVLNELRNKNILTFNRRRLLIRNMELLRAEVA